MILVSLSVVVACYFPFLESFRSLETLEERTHSQGYCGKDPAQLKHRIKLGIDISPNLDTFSSYFSFW